MRSRYYSSGSLPSNSHLFFKFLVQNAFISEMVERVDLRWVGEIKGSKISEVKRPLKRLL